MNCQDVDILLHPYADGELDLVPSLQIEQHLNKCADCAQQVSDLRQLGIALSSLSLYHSAPASVRERVQNAAFLALPAREQHSSGWRKNWLRPAAVAAAILFLIGASATTGLLLTRATAPANSRLEEGVLASHVRSLQVNHLTDVVSTDRHTVKPWFNDKLDFSPQVLDLSANGFPLTGGRLDYVADRPVAALVYRRGKHAINVFTWPSTHEAHTLARDFSRQGFHICEWQRSGMSYWAISDLGDEDLDRFVRLFQEHTADSQPEHELIQEKSSPPSRE
jgi:anti-sigma factor RsiW